MISFCAIPIRFLCGEERGGEGEVVLCSVIVAFPGLRSVGANIVWENSRDSSQTILHLRNGYCKPVLRILKLESICFSRWQDLMLDRINFITD